MNKSLSLQLPDVPVTQKQQELIDNYKSAYILMKINIIKHQQNLLEETTHKYFKELKKQHIGEIHIQSAREDADKIAHNR